MMKRRNLVKAREDKGLTQAELAKAIGISHATVSKYESGKASPR
jgi:transcriptional regulator with XRE-family HTH domain